MLRLNTISMSSIRHRAGILQLAGICLSFDTGPYNKKGSLSAPLLEVLNTVQGLLYGSSDLVAGRPLLGACRLQEERQRYRQV